MIYDLYLNGYSFGAIIKELVKKHIKSPFGCDNWHKSTVRSILSNEKYKGDALLQKTYRNDFLSKKVIKNDGEVQQYYIENAHEAIIDKEKFALVQEELKKRAHARNLNEKDVFAGKIVCKECGAHFVRLFISRKNSKPYKYYVCKSRRYKTSKCANRTWLKRETIEAAFIEKANELITDKAEILKNFSMLDLNDGKLIIKKEALEDKLNKLNTELENMVADNSAIAQDQKKWNKTYKVKADEYDRLKQSYADIVSTIESNKSRKCKVEAVRKELLKGKLIDKFDEDLFNCLVEKVVVDKDKGIEVRIKE